MIRVPSVNASLNVLLLLMIFAFSLNVDAQTKKSAAAKSKIADKKASQSKTASKKDSASKDRTKGKENSSAKNEKSKQANSKRQAEEAKNRKIEETRRRAEEEARRQAILEENRRREEARREAEARHRAFENSLHTETIENIARDDTMGEDLQVRSAAVKALGKHAGMVVVMEPQTGKVLSIVNQDWAIRRSFKPCSTIKLVTAVAGLNEHVINEDGSIRSRNFPMTLDDALAFSNNSYFQTVGSGLGNSKMASYAQTLGLGQPTGINAAGETSGKVSFKNKNARIYSHGDDFEVSPLQLAVLVSAISNGGKVVVPQIPRTSFDKANFQGEIRRTVKLPLNNLQGVLPGMIGAAEYGTARRGVDHSLGIAGKTGSCIAQGSWVGLFASVAPVEHPQIAVVVITRGDGERGKYAAAVAGKIYESMRSRLVKNGSGNIAKVPVDLKPEPKINAKTSALLDKAEGEDSEDNDAAAKVKKEAPKQIIVGQTEQKTIAPAPPKSVAKSGAKFSDLFPPVIINVKKSRQRIVSNK